MKTRFFYAPRYCPGTVGEVTGVEAIAAANVETEAWEQCADYGKPLDPLFKLAISRGANAIVYSVTQVSLDTVVVQDLITKHCYRVPSLVWDDSKPFHEWDTGKRVKYVVKLGVWSHKLGGFVAPEEFNPDFAR